MHRAKVLGLLSLTAAISLLSFVPVAGATSDKSAVALAREALITRADFPTGWTTSPSTGSSNSSLGVNQIASCLHVPAAEVNYNPPTANSPTFSDNSEGLQIDDDVNVFPSTAVAEQQFGIYSSPRTPSCLAATFNVASFKASIASGIGGGAKIGTVVAVKAATPKVANESTALQLDIPFTYKAKAYTMTLTMVIIMSSSKKEGAQLVFTSAIGLPFAASLVAHLETVTAQRLD